MVLLDDGCMCEICKILVIDSGAITSQCVILLRELQFQNQNLQNYNEFPFEVEHFHIFAEKGNLLLRRPANLIGKCIKIFLPLQTVICKLPNFHERDYR